MSVHESHLVHHPDSKATSSPSRGFPRDTHVTCIDPKAGQAGAHPASRPDPALTLDASLLLPLAPSLQYKLRNVQYIACVRPPTASGFRLEKHFFVIRRRHSRETLFVFSAITPVQQEFRAISFVFDCVSRIDSSRQADALIRMRVSH